MVKLNFHVVEFYFHSVKQGIVIRCAGSDFVKGIDHLNDSVKDPLRHDKGEITGGSFERGCDKGAFQTLFRASLSADQISEALHDDPASQHVRKPCNTLAIAVGVFKRLCEVLGNQQSKVGILCFERFVLITVAVNGDNTVGVFHYYRTAGIHAERTDKILVFFRFVDDFALIHFICYVLENVGQQLHTYPDVDPVGECMNVKRMADLLHPAAAAAAYRDNTVGAGIACFFGFYLKAVLQELYIRDRGKKMKIYLVFQVIKEMGQHLVVDIRAKMADGGIQQVQVVAQALGFQFQVSI